MQRASCVEDAWRMRGGCAEDARRMRGGCVEDAWRMRDGWAVPDVVDGHVGDTNLLKEMVNCCAVACAVEKARADHENIGKAQAACADECLVRKSEIREERN